MFGYGRAALFAPAAVGLSVPYRNFRQVSGQISNYPPEGTIAGPEQLPPLDKGERRYFGIGQGNLRASPLQVANAMAAIARGGLYKLPKLFIEQDGPEFDSVALNISRQTLDVVRDGMSAVVGEEGGTAYNEFAYTGFSQQGVRVYGKTGSTENPNNAWFAGFAEDQTGRSVVIAVMVEGGQHGASDAAPLARDIIQFCIEAKYIGSAVDGVKQKPALR
jgi:penicillin-binding protein 2